ncbi:hypothetical protein AA0117_g13484 [Alternaria alternata]|jgi:hypothetical protein|uniref:MADS-box domain-containing protein n=1 Tax=Alternaria alternata TaxID=5599 RepID=A0A4Q4MAY8_ALTAL|nr:hypothetical protein AA0117_g13484 [Alternaria alternata]
MASLQHQKQTQARSRRAANNNYSKQTKTLKTKLDKFASAYGAEVYCIVRRNGRIIEFASRTEEGKPWSPPDQNTLVSGFVLAGYD